MDRRKFVLSVGALAGGGSLALGTGAFSSVEAERDVGVTVADDASAYLGIQPGDGPNGDYADTTDNDALAVNLTDSNDNLVGEGINTNAVTTIGDVFQIRNQGTQDIDAAVTPLAFGDIDGQLFPPNIDGALGVLLVPQNADRIGVEIEFGLTFPYIDTSLIGIRGLSPGDSLRFGMVAVAIPSSAVGTVDVDDEFVVTGDADGYESDSTFSATFSLSAYENMANVEFDLTDQDLDEESINQALQALVGP